MKKLTRMVTMGGFGLLAALAVGGSPVQAAPSNGASEAKPSPYHIQLREGVQIAGFYRTLGTCELAGRFGERRAYWDDYDCDPVRVGLRSGAWALQVGSADDWDRLGFTVPVRAVYGFPVQLRPVWAGQFGPGRPVPIRPGHPGWGRPNHPGHVRPGHPGHVRPNHPGHVRPGHPGHVRPGNPGHVRPGPAVGAYQGQAGFGPAASVPGGSSGQYKKG